MFHLEPGVDLVEREAAVVQQKLDRAGIPILEAAQSPHRGVNQTGTEASSHRGRRRLLDELLMTTLDAALPFDEPHPAPRVEQDLDLHVAGPPQVLLDEQIAISEICTRDTAGRLEGRREVRRSIDPGHTDPTAACGRLEEHWIPDISGDGPGLLDRFERSVHARGD